ncbi:MAG: hypothetical protein WC901_03025 [Candidatus Margulisiibacteriota bacterium]
MGNSTGTSGMPVSSQIGSRVLEKLRQVLNPEKSDSLVNKLIAQNGSTPETPASQEDNASQFFHSQKGTVV